MIKEHLNKSPDGKHVMVSDLTVILISIIFSLSTFCQTGNFPSCLILVILVSLVIIIKYLKIE